MISGAVVCVNKVQLVTCFVSSQICGVKLGEQSVEVSSLRFF